MYSKVRSFFLVEKEGSLIFFLPHILYWNFFFIQEDSLESKTAIYKEGRVQ